MRAVGAGIGMREKITDLEGAIALREALDREGRTLVFTNGCFDVLHAGHVRYLAQARALGDALIVGLNGDESVRSLKGPGRPVNPEGDRAEVLAALEAVDGVVVFPGDRATSLIEAIRPHLYAKGGDYTPESLHPVERAALDAAGTGIRILPLVEGRSTSRILASVRGGRDGGGPPAGRRPLRLGVLGSGKGSNFEAICAAIERGELDAEVVLVLADTPDAGIVAKARARGVEAVVVDPGPDPRRFGAAAQKEVRDRLVAAGVDLVILAGFMRILKDPVLATFEGRILNVHPSLLPAFPGLEAWRQALEAGASETGCTVHFVTRDVDAGSVVAQASVPVLAGDTPASLHARIQEVEHRLFPSAIAEVGERLRAGDGPIIQATPSTP